MDFNGIAEFIKTYILYQWQFFFVSLVLGLAGHMFKTRFWTKENAKRGRGWWLMEATLPIHAPVAGFFLGLFLWLTLGEDVPVGPGVDLKAATIILYYTGAGALSSILFHAGKHFLRSRGIAIPEELGSERPGPPDAFRKSHDEDSTFIGKPDAKYGGTLGPDEPTPVMKCEPIAPPRDSWRVEREPDDDEPEAA